jgi:hypothetical protein
MVATVGALLYVEYAATYAAYGGVDLFGNTLATSNRIINGVRFVQLGSKALSGESFTPADLAGVGVSLLFFWWSSDGNPNRGWGCPNEHF